MTKELFIFTGVALLFMMGGGMKLNKDVRGIRNNNPGNIESGKDNWQGAVGDDGRFIIFESPEYGVRAMARILKSYDRRGINTISEIISTWAPPFENDTQSYINSVSGRVGIDKNQPVTVEQYPEIIAAIIKHENGKQPYSAGVIRQGVDMAFV